MSMAQYFMFSWSWGLSQTNLKSSPSQIFVHILVFLHNHPLWIQDLSYWAQHHSQCKYSTEHQQDYLWLFHDMWCCIYDFMQLINTHIFLYRSHMLIHFTLQSSDKSLGNCRPSFVVYRTHFIGIFPQSRLCWSIVKLATFIYQYLDCFMTRLV